MYVYIHQDTKYGMFIISLCKNVSFFFFLNCSSFSSTLQRPTLQAVILYIQFYVRWLLSHRILTSIVILLSSVFYLHDRSYFLLDSILCVSSSKSLCYIFFATAVFIFNVLLFVSGICWFLSCEPVRLFKFKKCCWKVDIKRC